MRLDPAENSGLFWRQHHCRLWIGRRQKLSRRVGEVLSKRGYHYRVINQGVSGNTTKDAVARVNSIVALHPEAVVVEFGGNDGLRGLPLEATKQNLDSVLTTLQAAGIRILLVGITLPPNYGAEYIQTSTPFTRRRQQASCVVDADALRRHLYRAGNHPGGRAFMAPDLAKGSRDDRGAYGLPLLPPHICLPAVVLRNMRKAKSARQRGPGACVLTQSRRSPALSINLGF
jgi:hypothetical protein